MTSATIQNKPQRNLTKGARVDWSTGTVCGVPRNAMGVRPRSEHYQKNASPLERLSVSKFPFRRPILHGLLLELRSFRHRIQLLWQRGGTRLLETGLVYQQTLPQSYPVLNKQTQLRTQGIKRLLAEFPWLTGEDCHLFLLGWNAGLESGVCLDTAQNSADIKDSFVLQECGHSMPLVAVQQSTKHDPLNRLPSRE
jgi:hypothetical protein